MDDHVLTAAKAAGLTLALEHFPDDVAEAARVAASHRGVVRFPDNPAAEPWPAMDVSVGRAGVAP